MDTTINIFLAILKAALTGEKPSLDREISPEQWHSLFRLAGIHNVLPLFYEAVYQEPSFLNTQSLPASTKRRVTRQVITQTIRTAEFLELYDRLQAAVESREVFDLIGYLR